MTRSPLRGLLFAALPFALTLVGGPVRAGEAIVTLTPESRAELRSIARRLDGRAEAARRPARGPTDADCAQPADRQGANRAIVQQRGNGHEAHLSQGGTGQRAVIVQRGQGGSIALDQPSDVPVMLVFQRSRPMRSDR